MNGRFMIGFVADDNTVIHVDKYKKLENDQNERFGIV